MIKSWSYSRLLDFESCALKAKFKIIDKIPEPERPLPPGKTEHANDRGSRIHDESEKFVRNQGPLPAEGARFFRDEFLALKRHFEAGNASLEGEWGFDKEWSIVDWKEAWVRVKLDAMVRMTPQHAAVIDYKSGKRFGNEIKHGEQLQMYVLSTFLRYPEIEEVTAELWYLDVNELAVFHSTRERGLRLLKGFDRRGVRMTTATSFPPNPNKFSCMWCPYHPTKGSGDCKVGV